MARVSRFEKNWGGKSVYVCRACKKQTRETGDGESDVELCARCYEIAGLENSISDSEPGEASYEWAKKRLVELGVDLKTVWSYKEA